VRYGTHQWYCCLWSLYLPSIASYNIRSQRLLFQRSAITLSNTAMSSLPQRTRPSEDHVLALSSSKRARRRFVVCFKVRNTFNPLTSVIVKNAKGELTDEEYDYETRINFAVFPSCQVRSSFFFISLVNRWSKLKNLFNKGRPTREHHCCNRCCLEGSKHSWV